MNGLSVVIPSKTVSNILPCIESIRKNERNVRIIVIDNGLDWTTVGGFWEQNLPDVEFSIYTADERFIFSKACNQGIREAGDDDVILHNDDALLDSPAGFSVLQAAAANHPEIGIIGATTNLTGQILQHRQPSGGLRPVDHIAFVSVLIPKRTRDVLAARANASGAALNQLGTVVERPKWANSVFSGGVLDERYSLDYGCEDRDYCEQVRAAGLYVAVHDHCFVDHSKLNPTYRSNATAPGDFRQNYGLLTQKWGPLK